MCTALAALAVGAKGIDQRLVHARQAALVQQIGQGRWRGSHQQLVNVGQKGIGVAPPQGEQRVAVDHDLVVVHHLVHAGKDVPQHW